VLAPITEVVETGLQLDFVTRSGCHPYQGYYFCPPLPLNEFERFVGNPDAESRRWRDGDSAPTAAAFGITAAADR